MKFRHASVVLFDERSGEYFTYFHFLFIFCFLFWTRTSDLLLIMMKSFITCVLIAYIHFSEALAPLGSIPVTVSVE